MKTLIQIAGLTFILIIRISLLSGVEVSSGHSESMKQEAPSIANRNAGFDEDFANWISTINNPHDVSGLNASVINDSGNFILHMELPGSDEHGYLNNFWTGMYQEIAGDDTLFRSKSYVVYSDKVSDFAYGATASSPDGTSIYSPVIPGYHPLVDIKKVYPGDLFTPSMGIAEYPSLTTGHKIVDAVYKCALDNLYRCQSGEFLRYPEKGETAGMWQAGFRRGEGYGVWNRDVVYISMLMGSFYDPKTARTSLSYISSKGIDNGEDGLALPAVGVWDYYVVTGDVSLIKETYADLKKRIEQIEFNEKNGLGEAIQSSFLDTDEARQKEINGGYALSTQIIYAEAYRSMAEMGAMMRENPALIDKWRKRSKVIKKNVHKKFWNPSVGYYTEGRKGTLGYEKGYWENFGQSLAVWPRWGIAKTDRTLSVFKNNKMAFNEYGYCERHYVPPETYLGRDVWVHTETGLAIAAARHHKTDDLNTIFFSVVRDAAMNKTFMECINWDTGKGWRYPGQLWHSMGFISMVYYGMLGMEYDLNGISFKAPYVPEALKDLHIKNFKYRDAVLEIKIDGWGSLKKLLLDGKPVSRIDVNLSGRHVVTLKKN
ncbi:MAG: hypothetical protein IH594_11020 [Bacteroidales bacterium]|nr:hypothetical protein [Bacteroidales bacterium]